MRCKDAQRRSSAYLDGELSPETSAAVRGHLRTCQACEHLFEQEAALVEAASRLEPLQPPDAIWQGIQQRIAEEEVRDSQDVPLFRWIRWHWRPLVFGTTALAAALLFLLVRPTLQPKRAAPVAAKGRAPASLPMAAQATQVALVEAELAQADRHYLETIEELRAMLEEDRDQWSAAEAALVDARLAEFKRASIGNRLAVAQGDPDVRGRDSLYSDYRGEIGFLQSALAGEIPGAP